MCLDVINKRFWLPTRKTFIGYKVLISRQGSIMGSVISNFYDLNRWYDSEPTIDRANHSKFQFYRLHFHILDTLEDAKKWLGQDKHSVIYKVEYQKPTCRGVQDDCNIVVAKKMRILEKIEA